MLEPQDMNQGGVPNMVDLANIAGGLNNMGNNMGGVGVGGGMDVGMLGVGGGGGGGIGGIGGPMGINLNQNQNQNQRKNYNGPNNRNFQQGGGVNNNQMDNQVCFASGLCRRIVR